jgi:hypothetical protein
MLNSTLHPLQEETRRKAPQGKRAAEQSSQSSSNISSSIPIPIPLSQWVSSIFSCSIYAMLTMLGYQVLHFQ